MTKGTLPDFSIFKGKVVKLELRGKRLLRGFLTKYDNHSNLLLNDVEALFPDGTTESFPKCVIRGNSILSLELV